MSVESPTSIRSQRQWATRILGSGLLAAALLTSVTATEAAAGIGGYSEPQVAAIATSGLVRISTQWSGFVGYDSGSGPVRSERIDAVASCSGFVADGGGYIVTAGHCVDPQDGRQALIHQLIVDLTTSGTLTDTEAAAVTPHALQSWQAGGATDGSPIDRQVSVFAGAVDSGASSAAGLTASVVELRPVDQGDIALLLVQAGTPLPALRVAPRESEVGAQIGVMGYPSGSDGAIDPSLAPTFIAGRTSARQSGNGLPYLQIDAALAGMSGAPVVDMSGDVVGVVSGSPFPQAAGFSFASAAENVGFPAEPQWRQPGADRVGSGLS